MLFSSSVTLLLLLLIYSSMTSRNMFGVEKLVLRYCVPIGDDESSYVGAKNVV